VRFCRQRKVRTTDNAFNIRNDSELTWRSGETFITSWFLTSAGEFDSPINLNQNLIPNRTATTSFASSMALAAKDEYLAVSDATEGKVFLFQRLTADTAEWSFDSVLDIGAGSGNRISLLQIGYAEEFSCPTRSLNEPVVGRDWCWLFIPPPLFAPALLSNLTV
jgi:uncharacterized protein YfiM (DUF2279 family)